jgi:hypothetical protein
LLLAQSLASISYQHRANSFWKFSNSNKGQNATAKNI